MSDPIKKRRALYKKMKKTLVQVNDHQSTPLDLHLAHTLLERTEADMAACEAVHYSLIQTCATEADEDVQGKAFEPMEETYLEIKTVLRRIIQDLTPAPAHVGKSGSSNNLNIRLPAIELPTFDGNYADWTSFMDLFKATVDSNRQLAPSQKLQYLKAALQKEPANLVKSLTITDAHYKEALDLLKGRYENKRDIITSLVTKLLSYKQINNESAFELQNFLDSSSEILRALRVLGEPVDQWNSFLVVLHVSKLDSATRREWAICQAGTAMPTFQDLSTFLTNHIRGLHATGSSNSTTSSKPKDVAKRAHHTSTEATCAFCKGNHPNWKCQQFLSKTPTERSTLAKTHQLCFNCLSRDHHIKQCRSKWTCRKCNKKHNTLLHEDREQVPPRDPPAPSAGKQSSEEKGGANSHHATARDVTLLKTAIVRVPDSAGILQPVRVFLDDGSEVTIIKEACVQRLGLRRQWSSLSIGGVGGTKAGNSKGKVSLRLAHKDDNSSFLTVAAHIMLSVTDHLPRRQVRRGEWSHLKGLPLADPEWFLPSEVDILLGSDYYNDTLLEGFKRGPDHSPSAQNTIFGWVLSGTVEVEPNPTFRIHHSAVILDNIVRRFWEVEELPKVRVLANNEVLAEKHFIENYSRDSSGRYQVGVPFNEKKQLLGASRAMAVKRWTSVERRVHRNPAHLQQYQAFMQEYEALGHMERIPPGEALEEIGSTYHLPHHHVINEGSSTTKLRVVFDGSARTSSGISLNEALHVGATLQDDLYDLLLRFRLNPIVIKADITKMFRQFRLKKEDADFHRIVWRESPEQPLVDFRLLTVTYGTACAPNLSTRCLQQLAQDCQLHYPMASRALLSSTYVDDVMATARTSEEGIELFNQLTDAVATAGLQLRKWSTNDPTVLAKIPEDQRESTVHSFDSDETIKALGVQWCPNSDNFTFKCINISGDILTKRVLLADLSRVFDPIGFLSCVTVRAKLQMQELWKREVDWDDQVPVDIQDSWNSYQEEMQLIAQIKIPRCITENRSGSTFQLHGFSDASTIAFGCCVYLRETLPDGTINVNLVTSKTRVAPLKQITLPRLELMSACELSVLIDHVKETFAVDCEVWCWSDSTITLKWIASSPRRWQTFVANRVATIQQHTAVESWRHVPGTENPADLASRGVQVREILDNSFWFNGPPWLSQQQFPAFPMNAVTKDVNLEEKKVHLLCHHLQVDTSILVRFSSLIRLKRVTAHILRLFHNGKKLSTKSSGPLTVTELENAFQLWIRKVQQQAFGEDIHHLQTHRKLPQSSKLHSLFPFVDGNGILKVGGRLQHAQIPEERKHQIILPCDSHLTNLLIHHYHHVNFHGGFRLTWSALQTKFWILRGRDKVRHFIRSCVTCRKHRGQVAEQLMGNLPSPRVTPSRPFLHVGVDYAGPFVLKNPVGRAPKTYKGYMCLFVCMATKAMDLQAVSSLSTAAFIEALQRFVSKRGLPAHIYSDCGTNFVGAEKELLNLLRSSQYQNAVGNEMASQGIQFHFNPPAAPHQGGLWEAGVKSAKHHLRRVVGGKALTYEVFSTFLSQVEAILNSRPLHPLSPDPDDVSALTPGHFLIGEPLTAIPNVDLREANVNRLSLYQLQQQRLQHFWHRWSMEYLNSLQQRNKWKWIKENVRVGDLVLIKEDTGVQQWKMGRITKVYCDENGHVRVADLKTATGNFQRPVVKLIPLISQ